MDVEVDFGVGDGELFLLVYFWGEKDVGLGVGIY